VFPLVKWLDPQFTGGAGPKEDMAMNDGIEGWRLSEVLKYNVHGNRSSYNWMNNPFSSLRINQSKSQYRHVGALVQLELSLERFKRFRRVMGCSDRGSSLLMSIVHLESRENSVSDDRSYAEQFSSSFPPWHMWIPALSGLVVGWWGWHSLRNNRRLFWGICAFLFGIMLWGYEVYKFIEWNG
jgi:hypothetical protein